MYWKRDMIEANGTLFQVLKKFKIESFQPIVDTFSAQVVCEEYHCDKLLKGNDGFYYLVNEVKEAEVL
jgi:hypothetical protein